MTNPSSRSLRPLLSSWQRLLCILAGSILLLCTLSSAADELAAAAAGVNTAIVHTTTTTQKEIRYVGDAVKVYDDQHSFTMRLSGMVGNFQPLISIRTQNEDKLWVQDEDFTVQTVLRQNDPNDADESVSIDDGILFIYLGPNRSRWTDTDSIDGNDLPVKLYLFSVESQDKPGTNYLKHPFVVATIYRKPRVIPTPTAIYYQQQTQSITINTENAKGLTYLDLRFEDDIFLGRDFYFHSTFPLQSNEIVLHLLAGRKWRSVPGLLRLSGIDTGGGFFGVNVELGIVEDRKHSGQEVQLFPFTGGLQSIFLPHNLKSMTVEVAGAAGGSMIANEVSSCGAIVKTIISIDKLVLDNDLYFLVGGMGKSGMEGGTGGFNGGGSVYHLHEGTRCNYTEGKLIAGGGGGSSDIRIIRNGIATRIVVAGGGGGGVIPMNPREKFTFTGGKGGHGGGVNGIDGTSGIATDLTSFGHGGSQKEGGAPGAITACHSDESTTHGVGVEGKYWKGGDSHECSAGGGGSGYLSGGAGSCSGGGGGGSSTTTKSPVDKVVYEEGKNCGDGYIKLWTEYFDLPVDSSTTTNDDNEGQASADTDALLDDTVEEFIVPKLLVNVVIAMVIIFSVLMVACLLSRFCSSRGISGGKSGRQKRSAYEMVPLDDDNLDDDEIAFMEGGPRRH